MRRFALLVWMLLTLAVPVTAQPHLAHWGVTGTFTPRWTSPSDFDGLYEVTPTDVKGSDFRVGIVRGKETGGEWGVTLVHKRISKASTMGEYIDRCEPLLCLPEGTTYTLDDASLTGAMFHAFIPFATIKRKVQFGVSVGAGAAGVSGAATADRRTHSYVAQIGNAVIFARDANGNPISHQTFETVKAGDLIKHPMLLLDGQVSISATVAPGLKLRASGGLSLPGYQPISISFVYLIGM